MARTEIDGPGKILVLKLITGSNIQLVTSTDSYGVQVLCVQACRFLDIRRLLSIDSAAVLSYAQVWLPLPVLMVVVSVYLIVMPVLQEPVPSLSAFGVILLGVPVYLFLVMEIPWKLRPKVFDQISGMWRQTLLAVWGELGDKARHIVDSTMHMGRRWQNFLKCILKDSTVVRAEA